MGYTEKGLERNFNKFKNITKSIKINDDIINIEKYRHHSYDYFLKSWEKSKKESLYDFLYDFIDPDKNGFIVTTPKNFKYTPSTEVWIGEDKCLMIEESYENTFFEKVK